MEDMKHVLLVANSLSQAETADIQNTLDQMAKEGMALKVSILYVKPFFPTCYLHAPSMIAVSEDFEQEAKDSLSAIGEQLSVPAEQQWIATGRVKAETLKIAATLGVDFILASKKIHKKLNHALSLPNKAFDLPEKDIDNLAAA